MGSSFEDLEVWKRACKLAERMYGLLRLVKEYALKDQMLRAVVSIPSNIAEGQERKSKPDFKRFLRISQGSAAELRTQVYIAKNINMLEQKDANEIIEELKVISKMLQSLINALG